MGCLGGGHGTPKWPCLSLRRAVKSHSWLPFSGKRRQAGSGLESGEQQNKAGPPVESSVAAIPPVTGGCWEMI